MQAQTSQTAKPYQVIDGKTGALVGAYKTRAAAIRVVDRKDNEYGAYRYRVRFAA